MRLIVFALGAVMATGIQAAELSLWDKLTLRNACAADLETLCGGIEPGEGRLRQCLSENAASFSDPCLEVLLNFEEKLGVMETTTPVAASGSRSGN